MLEGIFKNTFTVIKNSSDIINVKYPPAPLMPLIGDGITDDTQSFTNVLTFASLNNTILIIPYGSYIIKGNLLIPSNVEIVGINKPTLIMNNTILLTNVSNVIVNNIKFEPASRYVDLCNITNCQHILFKNCEINGKSFDGDTVLVTGMGAGFYITSSVRVDFYKNTIYSLRDGKGIEYVGCIDCSAIGNYVHHTGRAGISISNNNDNCRAMYNRLDFNVINFNINDGALDLYGPNNHNTLLTGNVISNFGSATKSAIGIRIRGSHNTKCYKNVVNSSLYSFGLIVVQPTNDVVDCNVDINSNTLNLLDGTYAQYIIRVVNANIIKVRNNVITSIGEPTKDPNDAIIFRQIIKTLICENNVICSDDLDGYFPSSGIYFHPDGSNFKDVIIRNNQIKVVGDGIYIANCQNTICNENIVSNQYNGNGAITTNLCADIIMKNNIITQPSSPRISDVGTLSTGVIKSDNIFKTI